VDLGIANKRILVTGASRGIGLAIADTFLQEGARVMLLARTQSALQEAAGRLHPSTDMAAFVPTPLTARTGLSGPQ